MKLNRIYFVLIVFLPFLSQAQERGIPVYSDYLTDNLYLLHPSMAGASSTNKIRLTARQQWFDVQDAPSLQTLSINGRIGEKVGVGAIIFNDANGNFSQQGAYLTFAYHLALGGNWSDLNMLSFGLNVGVGQEKLDETGLVGGSNPNDPIISGGVQSDAYFNVDFGMSYYYQEFFAHFTVKNVIPQKRDIYFQNSPESAELTNQRQYVGSLGYVIAPNASDWSFEPSLMAHLKEQTREMNVDLNAKVYHDVDFGMIWGGLSYRRSLDGAEYDSGSGVVANQKLQYLTPFLGINFKNFMFAYTYSYQANSIVLSNSGFHQITLGYNFGGESDRYECNCPAINF
ncbi:MAG TPA: type IX secretion system membrane protein PorP/SprF [Flavobacteriaceae bacterium]|nr:type IX secretion system membrane protein PorP/SprF [Flavobacteriaceae bacterium]